jgi:hypothetical protein
MLLRLCPCLGPRRPLQVAPITQTASTQTKPPLEPSRVESISIDVLPEPLPPPSRTVPMDGEPEDSDGYEHV